MRAVYYLPGMVNPFWREVVAGMDSRAKAAGVALEIVSSNQDAALQLTQVKDCLQRRPDGVFVSPVDMSGISPICKSVLSSGIPIFAIDQNLNPNVSGSIISGNMKGGILAAAYIAERLESGSRVLHIKAEQGLSNVMLRTTSFVDEIKRKGLLVIREIIADSDRGVAFTKMCEFLRENVAFDAVFAENDNMALGAVNALKEKRYSPSPLVVGYDGIPEALEAIRNGSMDATISQDAAKLGQAAIETLLLAIKGSPFKAVTTVMPRLITRGDVALSKPDAPSI